MRETINYKQGTTNYIREISRGRPVNVDSTEYLELTNYSMTSVFEELESDLVAKLGIAVAGHVELLLEVMKSAARNGDEDYFLGHTFAYHCKLLGLDSRELQSAIAERGLAKKVSGGRNNSKEAIKSKATIIRKYESGKYSKRQLSSQYSVSVEHINTILKDATPQVKRDVTKDYEAIRIARANGDSIRTLTARYSVSPQTIYKALLDK